MKVKCDIDNVFVVVFYHMLCIGIANKLFLATLLHQINNAHALIDGQLFGKVQLKCLLRFGCAAIQTWWRAILVPGLTPVNWHRATHLRKRQVMMTE